MIRKGDILLVRNYLDPLGWIISWMTKSKWTHVAWCLNESKIFDPRGSKIVISPIKKYLKKRIYKVKLLRLKDISKKEIKKAMDIALNVPRKRNYFKFLWTLMVIGFGCIMVGKPIITCSGLIAKCLSQVGFYFHKSKKPSLITPADIDQSKKTVNITAKELK